MDLFREHNREYLVSHSNFYTLSLNYLANYNDANFSVDLTFILLANKSRIHILVYSLMISKDKPHVPDLDSNDLRNTPEDSQTFCCGCQRSAHVTFVQQYRAIAPWLNVLLGVARELGSYQ